MLLYLCCLASVCIWQKEVLRPGQISTSSWLSCQWYCRTICKEKGILLCIISFLLEDIHEDSWKALSCNTGEVCCFFFFFPSSIFGGVVGLIGCFSFGFFMLVMYFIWQRGLTALLEIEFIFFYSSHMPLG